MVQAPQAAISTQQLHAQQQTELQKHREQTELARRKSQKPVDRSLPEGLEDIIIGDGVEQYNSLRAVEGKLDALMMRKRLDVQDSASRPSKQFGTLRIWISNTAYNQPWQSSGMDPDAFDFTSGVDPSFRVKIEGRLLDPGDDGAAAANDMTGDNTRDDEGGDGEPARKRAKMMPPVATRKKLSHFFKHIKVDFDRPRHLQPDGYTSIEWTRPEFQPQSQVDPPREADFDCLEFERKSDENINITIKMKRDEYPERYKLAPKLAELLDMEEADRKTVLMAIWEYIKSANLQEDDESRRITCDARLGAVSVPALPQIFAEIQKANNRQALGFDSFSFPHLPEALRTMLFDPEPISLPYTIRVDKEYQSTESPEPTVYDIPVALDDPLRARMIAVTQAPLHAPSLHNIARTDDQIASLVQSMAHSKAKHAFFTSMSKDPANFVKRWISSQKRDLDVVLGSSQWGEEDWQDASWRKGGLDGPWGSREAWEGVGTYLTRLKGSAGNV